MSSFFIFITLASIVSCLLVVVTILPWLRQKHAPVTNDTLTALNVSVFKQRLTELDEDRQIKNIDEATYFQQKTELERQLLQADEEAVGSTVTVATIKTRLILSVWILLVLGMAYAMIGSQNPVFKLWQAQDELNGIAEDLLTGKLQAPPSSGNKDGVALLSALQTNVHQHAYDAERWQRLSDVFLALDANEQAITAMSRAYRLAPADASVATRYAQTRFFLNDGMLDEEGRAALVAVLQANPEHQGAQMLMAMGEARAGNFQQAQGWVSRLKVAISQREGDNSKALASLDELSKTITQQETKAQLVAEKDVSLDVEVMVSAHVRSAIEPTDVMFITVRDKSGGAPYAVARLSPEQWQTQAKSDKSLQVTLNNGSAMLPSRTLSTAMVDDPAMESLVATARISKSGQAMPSSGDVVSEPVSIRVQQNGKLSLLKLQVNRIVE